MKRILAITLTVALVGGLFTYAAAHGRGGRWGGGNGQGQCWQDSDENGRGKGSAGEYGERRGRGYGRGDCDGPCRGDGPRFSRRDIEGVEGEIDNAEEATAVVGWFLEKRRNPNLKVGKVTETGRDYEVEIVTQDGSLANKLYVEKNSGRIFPAYK
jgi:hypothetical protein